MVPEFRKIRLRFSKLGPLKFISHLDLDRTMKSAITRSGVKIEYTHGYNPRPHLVFSLPASLGMESKSEFLDIKAESGVSPEDVKDRLNAALPPDIRMLEAYEPQSDFKQISSSEYDITLTGPGIDCSAPEKIGEMFKGPVIVEKRTKKTESGTVPFDIAPYVRIGSCEFSDGRLFMNVTASASNVTYINPDLIVKAICSRLGAEMTDPETSLYTVLRTRVFFENGEQFR